MQKLKGFINEIKKHKQLKNEIRVLKKKIEFQERKIEEKDRLIDYYMDDMHRYKYKCIELRRKLMEAEK